MSWEHALMIKNTALLRSFERDIARREPVDHHRNLLILESLYLEARALGGLPLTDPLSGIEVDIQLARVLNVPATPRKGRHST